MKHFSGSCLFSLHLLHVNHLFFHVCLPLSGKKKKIKNSCPLHHHICSLWQGGSIAGQARSQMRGLRGRSEVAYAGAVVEVSPSARHSGSGGFLHDCTRLRGYQDKKWSFNANLLNFPQRSFRVFVFEPLLFLFSLRNDVSVTSSAPENISHDAAVTVDTHMLICCNTPMMLTYF